ncbi:MAG: TonB-dependent receptor plug domain-containing protein, partial [Chitinophagaceae bacterium]
MRKMLILFQALLLFSFASYSQSRQITGQVKDESGNPVPFATVSTKRSLNDVPSGGTSADANGFFKIDAGNATSIVISSAGFTNKEIALVEGTNNITVELGSSAQLINEVVVTALGIRRNKNQLPYAAQQINGEAVSQNRSGNFVSALSGKVSGVEIRQGNAMGGSTNVVIRGTKSLTKNNQAMFVVDGVPIDNSNNNSNGGVDPLRNQQGGRGGFDYGNAAADVNPDDIESVTVLKGAAATALYGSRAANGVVMITTKKGRRGLGVTVNSGVTMGKIDKTTYAKYQNQYGAGYATSGYGSPDGGFFYFDVNGDGTKDLVTPTTEDASYGVKFDPNIMVYQWDAFDRTSPNFKKSRPWVAAPNNPTQFFETAVSTINSVILDGGSDKGNFKLGYTRNEEKGILPNSRLLKNLVNFGSSYHLSEKLTAAASINFSRVDGKGRFGTGYDDWNVNQSFRQWNQANTDVREQKEAYMRSKQNVTWNWAEPSKPASGLYPIYTDNPYWNRYENYETDSRYRYFGNASLTYNPTDWLNILGRVSLDSYDELQEERVALGSHDPSSYSRFNRTFREYNYDLLANFNKDINTDFNLKALAGINIRRTSINSIYAASNGGLVVPKLYSLTNSLNAIKVEETADKVATDGYFGGITLGYKEMITLDGTARVDRSSTLPEDKNVYFYPSVSA